MSPVILHSYCLQMGCGVHHNDWNVKILTKQHSFRWPLYLLAELDVLFRFDWLCRGELRSLFSEYLRHESLSDLSSPAAFLFTDAKKQEMYFTSLGDPENTGKGCELRRYCWQSGVRGRWGFGEVSLQLLNIKRTQRSWVSPDLSTLTTVWGGNRTPTLQAKPNLKTHTTPVSWFTSAEKCECEGYKISAKHFHV